MPGLTTQVDIIIHGTYVYRAVGRDRLPYVSEHWVLDHRFTNVANGKYVTIHVDLWENDIFVKDNRDGTNTGLNVGRVYSEMHDADGRKLEYESTWTLSRWSKDNGGTPRDPGDDEWLDWVDLRQVGHVADYCSATVAAVSDPGQASRTRDYPSWRTLAPVPTSDTARHGRSAMTSPTTRSPVTLAALVMAIVPLGGVPTSPSLAAPPSPQAAHRTPDARESYVLPGDCGYPENVEVYGGKYYVGQSVRPDVPR